MYNSEWQANVGGFRCASAEQARCASGRKEFNIIYTMRFCGMMLIAGAVVKFFFVSF